MRRAVLVLLAGVLASAADAAVSVRDAGTTLAGLERDLQADDVLLAWQSADGRWHDVEDALSWWQLELAQAPLGPLRLRLQRAGQQRDAQLPGGRWDWQLQDSVATTPRGRAWQALSAAASAAAAQQWPQVASHCTAAVETAADLALEYCWQLTEASPDRQAGVALAQELVRRRSAAGAPPLLQARAQLALARSAFTARDYATAAHAAAQALRHGGGTQGRNSVVAGALQVQGFIAYRDGRLDTAMNDYAGAEQILRQVAADSAQLAGVHGAIATVHGSRGDLDTAVALAEQAIAQMARVAPGQMALGRLQYNAGLMAFERGRLDRAEHHLEAAMATFAHAAPAGPEAAMSRAQLAQTLERRGESVRAEALLRRAVDAGRHIDAAGYETLSMRVQLAIALAGQQRVDEALEEADAVAAATAGARSDTLHADALALRAALQLERGAADAALADADAAAALLRARDRRIQLAPVLIQRGEALRRLRRFDEAAPSLAEALQLRRRYAPHTVLEAEALLAQARLQRDRGDAEAALGDFAAALNALEAQRDLLGGDEETRTRWAARSAPFYREMLALLLQLRREDAAWLLLDRYRAREFLATLGRRREALLAGVDASLQGEARAIAEDYLRLQKLAQSGAALPADSFAPLQQRGAALRIRLAQADPRLAGLGPPVPALAADVAAALPADAALVSYAVLAERSWAFVLHHGQARVQAVALDIDAPALARQIDALRLLLTVPGAGAASRAALQQRGEALYAQLLAPLAPLLGDARRLYLIPDGPLHRLPFAALREPGAGPGAESRFLAADRSLTLLVSASAYLSQHAAAGDAGALRVAVLAAPVGAAGDGELPAARAEAEAIAALFAGRARLQVGAALDRASALAALREADLVHFASHAVVDPVDPLASYLRLGPAESDRLSAGDLMHAPPLRADLVTLSACDSALGFNAGGEGLVGLTRAFQFAGARSVVATLWRVADRPTEPLMRHFYAELAAGTPRDLALARAQRALMTPPPFWRRWLGLAEDYSHPYFWSAFVLAGAPQ